LKLLTERGRVSANHTVTKKDLKVLVTFECLLLSSVNAKNEHLSREKALERWSEVARSQPIS
jgi:hypothetical protein